MDSCRFTKTGLTLGETRATENNPGESERNTSALKRGGSAGRSKGTPNKLTIACKAYGWPHLPTERYERRTAKEETLEVWEKDPSVHAFADLMNRTIDKPSEQPIQQPARRTRKSDARGLIHVKAARRDSPDCPYREGFSTGAP